jgi:hypothetical protein
MVYGLWFMVYGLWFMVYDLWFRVKKPTTNRPQLILSLSVPLPWSPSEPVNGNS